MTLDELRVGTRVQLHPGTDAWMMVDRFGTVIKLGRSLVQVKTDRSGRTLKVRADNILEEV